MKCMNEDGGLAWVIVAAALIPLNYIVILIIETVKNKKHHE